MDMLGPVMAALGMNARRAVRVGDPATEPAPAAAPSRSTTVMPIAPFGGGPRRVFRQDQPLGVGAVLAGYRPPPPPEQQKRDQERAERFGAEAGRLSFQSNNAPRVTSTARVHRQDMPMGPGGVAGAAGSPAEVAARETGVDAQFIERLVGHESGGDAEARNPNSTATGHGQFIESTWLNMLNQHGEAYGLNPNLSREDRLRLRTDPRWSALMVAHYAQENRRTLRDSVGRGYEPSAGHVYLAHFLGPREATALIKAERSGRGGVNARTLVSPAAVEANRSIFYSGTRPRSVRDVIELQSRNFQYAGNHTVGAAP